MKPIDESSSPRSKPSSNPSNFFQNPPLAPPTYGFHSLERRTIVLFDGTVKSYFALPPDDPISPAVGPGLGFDAGCRDPRRGGSAAQDDYWSSLGLDGPQTSAKRKYGEDGNDWLRESIRRYGNPDANPNPVPSGFLGREVKQENGLHSLDGNEDSDSLMKAFLKFSQLINENLNERKKYLADGKNGPLKCIACGRTSKEFIDVHALVMHAYTSQNADLRIDHLGLHKALCVLMGWNYAKAPENSKGYQSLSAGEAAANREDLIIWPPTVIIHNTNTGRRKDGRMDGMGNKEMDGRLREFGFCGGTSKSLYGKGGHLGVTSVRFASTQAGLKEAEHLLEYFARDKHGREDWANVEAFRTGDDEKNPALVMVDEKTGEKSRIFYGYLATASDFEKVDIDTRKRATIKSRREIESN